MKFSKLIAILLISSIFYNCATRPVVPKNAEVTVDGLVLTVENQKLRKTVEHWGFENGFKFVAYKKLDTEVISERKSEYVQVLVMEIDDMDSAPADFNVVVIPTKLKNEFSMGKYIAFIAVIATVSAVLGYMTTHRK